MYESAEGDFLSGPVDVAEPQAADFPNSKAIDCKEQDRAAAHDLKRQRVSHTRDKLLHFLPGRPLRQIFVSVEPGRIDGLGDSSGAPAALAGVPEEGTQVLYVMRDTDSFPSAYDFAGKVFGGDLR